MLWSATGGTTVNGFKNSKRHGRTGTSGSLGTIFGYNIPGPIHSACSTSYPSSVEESISPGFPITMFCTCFVTDQEQS